MSYRIFAVTGSILLDFILAGTVPAPFGAVSVHARASGLALPVPQQRPRPRVFSLCAGWGTFVDSHARTIFSHVVFLEASWFLHLSLVGPEVHVKFMFVCGEKWGHRGRTLVAFPSLLLGRPLQLTWPCREESLSQSVLSPAAVSLCQPTLFGLL